VVKVFERKNQRERRSESTERTSAKTFKPRGGATYTQEKTYEKGILESQKGAFGNRDPPVNIGVCSITGKIWGRGGLRRRRTKGRAR